MLYYQTRKVCHLYAGMDPGRGGCLPLFQWGKGRGERKLRKKGEKLPEGECKCATLNYF